MCPAGMALVETLMAFSFSMGQWIEVGLCYDGSRGSAVRQDTGEEVEIYQVIVNTKAYWIIEEGDGCGQNQQKGSR